jgi:hypothetical protein
VGRLIYGREAACRAQVVPERPDKRDCGPGWLVSWASHKRIGFGRLLAADHPRGFPIDIRAKDFEKGLGKKSTLHAINRQN